jgi:hypothetical protein
MTEAKKKIAAAIAAVAHYLEAEAAALPSDQPSAEAAPAGPKLWALNGRQFQMQLRNLMQLRALGRMR